MCACIRLRDGKAWHGMRARFVQAELTGDILVTCRTLPGDSELFRFSFWTALMVYESVPGAYRLHLSEIDMEKRKSREGCFPSTFMVDLLYTPVPPSSPALRAGIALPQPSVAALPSLAGDPSA
ncbi:hypothetical protein EON66_01390 [archaeon]|nr:MAG: hypothetical protein EON66_01390 [archaeon]